MLTSQMWKMVAGILVIQPAVIQPERRVPKVREVCPEQSLPQSRPPISSWLVRVLAQAKLVSADAKNANPGS